MRDQSLEHSQSNAYSLRESRPGEQSAWSVLSGTESQARGVVAWQESRRGSRLRSSNVLARDAFGILLILRPGPR
jgi:hypothetical protein